MLFSVLILHPQLGKALQRDVASEYIAVTSTVCFVHISHSDNAAICKITMKPFCYFNTAPYPKDKVTWCMYALIIKNKRLITTNCQLKVDPPRCII